MSNSWEKVRSFLDSMDIQDLRSTLSSSFSSFSSLSSSNCARHSSSIGTKRWQVCETTVQQILPVIQPDAHSENTRKEIIEYLQGLIEDAFRIKVFPFGSVPLKTYLPHGDIDLTAVSYSNTGQDLAAEICGLLENEEKNRTCIQVKDVLCVPAQVRVVKCTVGGISVDISVNQTAGLAALYFLDQVDQFVGKDHLFKCSVILIKAWCYYESRLLGGFHGLISTYALETMVLHVINLFHSSLHCPLAALHKFLDYYSSFDWNSYCIGFNGLVLISSLPEIVVKLPHDCDDDLLLTDAFLRSSREPLLYSMKIAGSKNPTFPVKFLNILDPLREDNNLGRSVSKGNFYRIRSALSYAAQNLGGILMLPVENIKTGLEKFFKNTLELNGKGRRADVAVPVSVYGSEISTGNDGNDYLLSVLNYGGWFHDYGMISAVVPETSADQQVWNDQWVDMNQNLQFHQGMYYSVNRSSPSQVDGFDSSPFTCASPVNWTSRGTGTYIPQLEYLLRRNVTVGASEERYESGEPLEMWGCPAYTQRGANLSDEGGNSDVFNLSIEEFPLLPGAKPMPVKVSQWSIPEPEIVKDTSASLDSLEFDSIKQSSPRSLSLSEAGKQSDSDVSVVMDTVSDLATIVTMPEDQELSKREVVVPVPEDHESSKNDEIKVEPVEPLQLEDDKEFPPLSRPPQPVITLNKKEFPPLRACLKSHKRGKWNKDIK